MNLLTFCYGTVEIKGKFAPNDYLKPNFEGLVWVWEKLL